MLFLDAMEEFLYDCECRHLTKGTIRNYRAALSFLNSYLEAKGKSTVEDVTANAEPTRTAYSPRGGIPVFQYQENDSARGVYGIYHY